MKNHHVNKNKMVPDIALTISLIISIFISNFIVSLVPNDIEKTVYFISLFVCVKILYNGIMHFIIKRATR